VNRADYATEEEFKQAQRAALTSQRRYVEQLKNTPISKILGANRSGFALSKDQDKAENKEYEDENKKRRDLVNNQITSIQTAYSRDPRVTRAIEQIRKGEEVTAITSASPEIMNVVDNVKNLQKEYDELDKKITASKKAKDKDAKIQEAKEAQKELKDEEGESEKPKNEKSSGDKSKK
jgi:hypothetical protein